MRTLRVHAQRFAESDAGIYIHGESGTGKELLAHAIHNASPRRHAPFVAVNCGALPESLLESELFGYAEGAFTGARRGGKQGLFELAQDGTIFLDEIADISAAVQVRLLRVLESGEIFRLGGDRPVTVNARVVCSSWKDLVQEVREGRFRADLYYRLTLLRLEMPPLRERLQDMTLLVRHIMRRMGMIHKKMPPEAIELLCSYPWPGNVRELDALLRRYCLMSTSDAFQMPLLQELLLDMRQTQGILASPRRVPENREEQDLPASGSLRQRLRLMEKKIIRQELVRQQYSKKKHCPLPGDQPQYPLAQDVRCGLGRTTARPAAVLPFDTEKTLEKRRRTLHSPGGSTPRTAVAFRGRPDGRGSLAFFFFPVHTCRVRQGTGSIPGTPFFHLQE